MRLEELEYALKQLRTSSWVDQRNLFLMGHSEGGITVACWGGGGGRLGPSVAAAAGGVLEGASSPSFRSPGGERSLPPPWSR
jgi:hypothetical protein